MALKSRKRQSTDSNHSAPADQPRAKRLRSWKRKHCGLLELPSEIRLRILKELLWLREPLKITQEASYIPKACPCRGCVTTSLSPDMHTEWFQRQCNFHFSPAILRTCRKLYDESHAVLYSNWFGCEVWTDFEVSFREDPYRSSFLRPEWNLNTFYLSSDRHKRFYMADHLLDNVKRLDVVVRVKGDEECISVRHATRRFARGTRKLPKLSHLKINLEMPASPLKLGWVSDRAAWRYENGEISRDDFRDHAIGPFALVRGLRSVAFAGVSDAIAGELKTLITGHSAVIDLTRRHEYLQHYVRNCIVFGHCITCTMVLRYLERAEYAADMEDEASFQKARSKVFSLIAHHQDHEREKACQHDADPPTDTGPDEEDEDEDDVELIDGSEWRESMQVDWDHRNQESEADCQQRHAEEQLRPSLIRLREIIRWERDESPWSTR